MQTTSKSCAPIDPATRQSGVAYLSDMVRAAVKSGKAPLPQKPAAKNAPTAPEKTRLLTDSEVMESVAVLRRFRDVLVQLAAARDTSDALAVAARQKSTPEDVVDAILAGRKAEVVDHKTAAANALEYTRAAWHALNRLVPEAAAAINRLQRHRAQKIEAEIADLEAKLTASLPPGLDTLTVGHALAFYPPIVSLRLSLVNKPSIGGEPILKTVLFTPQKSDPDRPGRKVRSGPSVLALAPWRIQPFPPGVPNTDATGWNPVAAAAAIDRLIAETTTATTAN